MSKFNSSDVYKQYEKLFPAYETVCVFIKKRLEAIVEEHQIKLAFSVSHRIKSKWSIIEKIESGRIKINKSIDELNDFAGIRIITLFQGDAKRLEQIINKSFIVKKSYNTSERQSENAFGYSSLHQIIEIPFNVLDLKTDFGLENAKAEIQLRTLSQHSWAEVSQRLQYKRESSSPKELQRSLSRISALLELVDLEYERMLHNRLEIRGNLEIYLFGSEEDVELNVDLLEIFLDSKLPSNNKNDFEEYSDLMNNLKVFDIITRDQLEELLSEFAEYVLEADKAIAKSEFELYKSGRYKLDPYEAERARKGVYFTHSGLVRLMLENKNPDLWSEIQKSYLLD